MTVNRLRFVANCFWLIGMSAMAVSLVLQFYVWRNEPTLDTLPMTPESFRLYQEQHEPFRRLYNVAMWLVALGTVTLAVGVPCRRVSGTAGGMTSL
jgi:hypothetical protein